MGLNPAAPTRGRRYAYPCLDWSERRDHLAGQLADQIFQHLLAQGWARKGPGRAVGLTPTGAQHFLPHLSRLRKNAPHRSNAMRGPRGNSQCCPDRRRTAVGRAPGRSAGSDLREYAQAGRLDSASAVATAARPFGSRADNAAMAIPIYSDMVHTPPLPAATVMVVRDVPAGLEVLLMRRHAKSNVLGGVHVFPGGKLDPADVAVPHTLLDQPAEACRLRLVEDGLDAGTAVGLHVAALRETFEECGLLIGQDAGAAWVPRLRALTAAGNAYGAALAQLGLALPVSRLLPWSRWVTPRVPSVTNKRFDTRFFLAVAPADQSVEHCAFEATEAVWVSPRAGLERYWAGEIDLAPPQIMSLCELASFGSVGSLETAARSRVPTLIAPEPFDVDGQRVICYPGDPAHSCVQRAWAGPTRLVYRNQRFEPDGGLAALLG